MRSAKLAVYGIPVNPPNDLVRVRNWSPFGSIDGYVDNVFVQSGARVFHEPRGSVARDPDIAGSEAAAGEVGRGQGRAHPRQVGDAHRDSATRHVPGHGVAGAWRCGQQEQTRPAASVDARV